MSELLERLARSDSSRDHWLKCVALVLLCLVAFAPGIASLPPTDRDESRYMQATKQMVASGDLIDIRLQNQPRYLQPVGIYWLQSLAVTVTGQGEAAPAWVYRTVSQLAAIIAVLACYAAGLRLFGPAAGFVAAIGLAGIFMLNFEARIAKTDATVLAAALTMQVALCHIYLGVRQQRPIFRFAPWLFWIAISLGLMVKGPIVPGLAFLTIAALSAYDRDLSWAKRLRPLAGLVIVLLVVLPWFAAITAKSGMQFWNIVLGKSMFAKIQGGEQSHGFPPGYYIVIYALTMWPFALETLRGGLKALRGVRTDPRMAYCVAWAVPMWLLFELVPTKLPHYVLPVFPSLLIVMGWSLTDPSSKAIAFRRWEVWLIWAATLGWLLVTGALAIGSAGLLPYLTGEWSAWGFVAAALALLAGWLGSGYRPPLAPVPRIALATLAAAAFAGTITSAVLPALTLAWPGKEIAQAFHANKPCPSSVLAVTGFLDPSVVFLAGTSTLLTGGQGAADHLKADPACAVAVVDAADEPTFQAAFPPSAPRPEAVTKFAGFNYSNGHRLALTLYRMKAN